MTMTLREKERLREIERETVIDREGEEREFS